MALLLWLLFLSSTVSGQRILHADIILCGTCLGGDGVAVDPNSGHAYYSDGEKKRKDEKEANVQFNHHRRAP